jgi:ATP-binding protein involved in chromosome partitioning
VPIQESDIQQALRTVRDPDSQRDLVTSGKVQSITLDDQGVRVSITAGKADAKSIDHLRAAIEQAIAQAAEAAAVSGFSVTVEFTSPPPTASREVLPGVRHVIAVGAGKGGVGKSTVSTLLALGLARAGASCGLLDGDIYGPSLGTMLGLDDLDPVAKGNNLMPFKVHGIKSMTIATLVDPEKPMIWRGPMAHKAFSQLLLQTEWGELDYLIVDLPPGTGDVPLSLAQALPLAGAVIVCTPQRVAQDDARRAVRMFGELGVPILGLVENMSWFLADDGTEYDLFGRGGAEQMAATMNLPFLGPLPLHITMRKNADAGVPLGNFHIRDDITAAIDHLASALAEQVAIQDTSSDQPTISVS